MAKAQTGRLFVIVKMLKGKKKTQAKKGNKKPTKQSNKKITEFFK